MDHDQADIDSSATGLWCDVFRTQMLTNANTLGDAKACAEHAAQMADAAETKWRERLARKPVA